MPRFWEHLDPAVDVITAVQDDRSEWTHGNSVEELPDGNLLVSYRNITTIVIQSVSLDVNLRRAGRLPPVRAVEWRRNDMQGALHWPSLPLSCSCPRSATVSAYPATFAPRPQARPGV